MAQVEEEHFSEFVSEVGGFFARINPLGGPAEVVLGSNAGSALDALLEACRTRGEQS